MARVPPQLVSVNGPQLAFLVGMNRIGCTWLARALNLHPQIAVFGQSRFWGKHYLTPDQQGHYGDSQRQRWLEKIAAFGWNATIGDELGCFPDVSVAQLRAALATSLERLATPVAPADAFRALAHAVAALKPQTAWVIEKTPHHVLHVPRILEALPQARFIVYRSTVTDHLRAWKSQADLLYHPAAVAVAWRRYRAACDWVERQLGDRAIVVDYDRLQHSPASELQSIQTFLGCDDYAWSSTLPPFYHGLCSTERLLALTAADRFWARRITGVDVSSGENRQPLDAAQIAASMCRLPVFALQHLWQNLPGVEGSWWAYYRKWLTTEKIVSAAIDQLGFLCGMPRSGTTWLGRTLASHPDIALFGESDFWGRDFIEPDAHGHYDARSLARVKEVQRTKDWSVTTGDDQPLPGGAPGDYARAIKRAWADLSPGEASPRLVFSAIASAVGTERRKRIVVEKTPGHLLFIDRVRSTYPSAPVIVLSREPICWMTSLIQRRSEGWLACRPSVRRFAFHPALLALWWRSYADRLLQLKTAADSRVLIIDYRELADDPRGVAHRAARHLGARSLDWPISCARVNSSSLGADGAGLPPAAAFWLRFVAARQCAALYPELRLEPSSIWAVGGSLLTLVPALCVFGALYRPQTTAPVRYIWRLFVRRRRSHRSARRILMDAQ